MLETNYRYYLSFENSICQDYVTEKFFRPFKYDVIPLTLNGADMHNLAPPHSFINVLDYETTMDLILDLKKLSGLKIIMKFIMMKSKTEPNLTVIYVLD